MEGDFIKINKALLPLSWIYGLGVGIRNLLFDLGIRRSYAFNTPVISVGNITVGGTGKTPVTEYLVSLLMKNNKVAILSRGYKRSSRGFRLLSSQSTPEEVGDEPYQMKRKFPDVVVAVDANRRRGISTLMKIEKESPEIILLDDAFQHRYVIPDISILLVDYNRMINEDAMLPVGMLREPEKAKNRADIIVMTKCPEDLSSIQFKILQKNLSLYPYQSLYFTSLKYGDLVPLFPEDVKCVLKKSDLKRQTQILTVTGIASPRPFEEHVKEYVDEIEGLNFSDHHRFSEKDYKKIESRFVAMSGEDRIIVTTEKDAVRMMNDALFPKSLKSLIYYIPLSVIFLRDQKRFDVKCFDYELVR